MLLELYDRLLAGDPQVLGWLVNALAGLANLVVLARGWLRGLGGEWTPASPEAQAVVTLLERPAGWTRDDAAGHLSGNGVVLTPDRVQVGDKVVTARLPRRDWHGVQAARRRKLVRLADEEVRLALEEALTAPADPKGRK